MNIVEILREAIKKALQELEIPEAKVDLEHPDELSHGDYSTNVALTYSKQLKMSPKALAEKIKTELEKKLTEGIEKIEIAGPGFINFYLTEDFFKESISMAVKAEGRFGSAEIGKGKKVLVEYSSPNIAKPFTIGHLRSTIIGDSIGTILSYLGYEVIRDNHLGDWGTQFGKQIVAIKHWSSIEAIKKSDNQMRILVDLYVRFHQEVEKDPSLEDEARAWFVKLEQGDAEAREIYRITVDASMKYFSLMYTRLNVSQFDTQNGEAFYEPVIPEVLKDIEGSGIAKESEGARLVFFEGEKYPPLMIQKKDGATLYATRDLATDVWRLKKYGNDVTIINEAGIEQTLYFRQLYEVEKMLGWVKDGQRIHIGHGLYRFKDIKMSTRKGNVIWLEEVLDEAVTRAGEINKDTAEFVGIGAIKFNDLKREAKQDIVFDWEEIVNLKGDSGPYLQYACVRARSIVAKASGEGVNLGVKPPNSNLGVSSLEKVLYRFPEVVERAGKEYSPHYIATYLIEIAAMFNNYYAHNKIIDMADPTSPYKVALTQAFSIVMSNGLKLLGIEVPEKM